MLSAKALRRWSLVHKWTSLVCTVFLLITCITGLPLIFSDEIEDWLAERPSHADLPASTALASLDGMVTAAKARFPTEVIRFVILDPEAPEVRIVLAPSYEVEFAANHGIRFDSRTGQAIGDIPVMGERPFDLMRFILRLHTHLFLDLPGQLFMAAIGVAFVAAVVSGLVLYAPFMRKLDFGTVRRSGTRRLKWLDLHNLIGIVTLAWGLVVGVTGIINELSAPMFSLWRATEVKAMLEPYRNQPPPQTFGSVQTALDTARAALPGQIVTSIVYPDPKFGSAHHYLVWTRGDRPLTARLFTPALIEAETGTLTRIAHLPWYLRLLQVSRPLHFGDYGGWPLKLIWTALDLMSIAVLGSGLYLWAYRRPEALDRQLIEAAAP